MFWSVLKDSAFGKEYMEKLPESVGRDHMHDVHTYTNISVLT